MSITSGYPISNSANSLQGDRPKSILASHVFLHREDHVLSLRRINTSYMTGRYCLPGGHVEIGETATEAALRETMEECGIGILKKDLTFCGVMHRFTASHPLPRVDIFFNCYTWEGSPKIAEPGRFDDLKWIPVISPPTSMVPFMAEALVACRGKTPWFKESGWDERVRHREMP